MTARSRIAKLETGNGQTPIHEDWLELLEDPSPENQARFEARFPRSNESAVARFLDSLA
ncbi:hypothetical protein [Brevundimonas sp. TWP3-1-2b1]|uniref:hypothetical protein n=1 Tax=Brevundimonas sp. TWP3-1-2b1 TaxID=2804650 RepID=UPI003CEDEC9D